VSTICPNGHESVASDYCDQCGLPLPEQPSATPAPHVSGLATDVGATCEVPAVAPDPCPDCGAPHSSAQRFCEACGYDFVNRQPAPVKTSGRWEAVIAADRDYFDRVATGGVAFPSPYEQRTVELDLQEIRIGRTSESRSLTPEIDLGTPPEDLAVSRDHAVLLEQPDGSYAVLDRGSTNGTTINDDRAPIPRNLPVALADGDRVHVGAWTTITIRRAHPAASDTR